MSSNNLNKLNDAKLPKKWERWTERDVYFLDKLFKVLNYKEISELFGLSEQEVRGALKFRVKSKKINRTVWTDDKISFLRDYYGIISIDDLAKALGCSTTAVHHKASRLGYKIKYKQNLLESTESKEARRDVEEFPNYKVSNFGKVINASTDRIITPVLRGNYYYVRLSSDNKIYVRSIHRLVAVTFIGDVNGKEVNHIDGNSKNNNLSNLEILSQDEHKLHTRLLRKYTGEKVNTSKLNSKQVIEMRKLYDKGDLNYSQIAAMYGLSKSAVRRAISKESWKHLG